MRGRSPIFGTILFVCSAGVAQSILPAHSQPGNISFIPSAAIFFDLQALHDPVVIEGFITALYAGPAETFDGQLLIRDGTSLGGTATTGPGSSLDGWTVLGPVHGMQGHQGMSGYSLQIALPRFTVRPGRTVGVAITFDQGVGPYCAIDGPYHVYQDASLSLTTGDVRSPAFYVGQFYFPRSQLMGSIIYDLVPCYPNCDGSTADPVLNVNDFVCFLTSYARGDSYANCDNSTTPPVLNVNDFICFMTSFATGCP